MDKLMISKKDIEGAFALWDSNVRRNPEDFMSQASVMMNETSLTCGQLCAEYFIELFNSVQAST